MSRHSPIPFLVACLGVAAFSAMDALMKGLSIGIGVYSAMLWRMAAGALIGGALFLALRMRRPTRAALRLHLLRAVVGTAVGTSFFYGIVRVPLAEGIAITFVAPLIALYLAAVVLDETIGRAAILASVCGFAGVASIVTGRLRIDFSARVVEGVAALVFSALLYAYALILQRQQAQVAKPLEIAFFQSLLVCVLLGLLAPFLDVVPPTGHLVAIAGSAALSLLAIALLAWAYARAQAQALLSVEYTAFIWGALFGRMMFGEQLTRATLVGTALIVAGCIIANYRRRAPPAHVEASAL